MSTAFTIEGVIAFQSEIHMTTTVAASVKLPTSGDVISTDGPIVLAAKPFDLTNAPLAMARWLAHREDRELRVITIVEAHDALGGADGVATLPARYYEEERAAIAARLADEMQSRAADGVVCRISVENGPSARSVVDLARECDARLIVIGTGRHDAFGRFVYGERAMQIVRAADRPVLVVPRGASAGPLQRAIVAVDFSRASLRAASAILPMLSFGAELTLVHVRPATPKTESDAPGSAHTDIACDDLFARFIRLLPLPPGINISTKLLWGDPVESIDLYAVSSGADLLACGRLRSHTLAERIFVGSVSAGLLRRAHYAILIAPELSDDARADARAPLTGVNEWEQTSWSARLMEFSSRNRGRRVRLGVEDVSAHGGRCVAQDFLLRSMAFNEHERLRILLVDRANAANRLAVSYGEIRDIALFSSIAGDDTRLVFGYDGGRGSLTLSPAELP